jgi:AcrR family transcriptional regulator
LNKIDANGFNVDYSTKFGKTSMKVSKTDPRSVRTCDLLRDAMLKLAAEKSFSSLTIQDVTGLAGLNRTTFYLHYAGLHELLEDCARTLFAQMRAEIYASEALPFRKDATALVPYVECVFRHLEQYEDFYRAMLGRQGDPLFLGLYQEFLSELIFEPIMAQKPGVGADSTLEINLCFFTAGFAGVAAWWLGKGKPISVEQASLRVASDFLPDYLRLMDG